MQTRANAARRGALLDAAQRVLYTCADVLATRSPSRWECPRFAQPRMRRRSSDAQEVGEVSTGCRRRDVSSAGLVVGRHDGRREVVKRFQVDCGRGRCGDAHRRVERVERVRRVERAGPEEPDQDRRAHAAYLQASNFVAVGPPGARRGGPGGERDQQVGRREGARAGATAQPRRRGRPVHEHDRGHRRLQAADPAGGRRLGRGHHRQPDRRWRSGGSPRRRRCRCSS